ncbi:MAG: tRNA preQ1(34) S-adenosylmethionine ribosyltransferase-isomerase QueA [Clostridium sp.]|nr:tRNA preQ1(34) S-adenosylmethionine ribosyltransferase-isomerase QueA [Clostridium sp.]
MNVNEFYYNLPEELIAQHPPLERGNSRLLVVDKITGEIEHKAFSDFASYLKKGDVLVLNDTRVIPARLLGVKDDTGGKIEFLLLNQTTLDTYECLAKPGKRAKVGVVFTFGEGILRAQVMEVLDNGNRVVKFFYEGIFEEILDQLGEMPLPPYIKEKLDDGERYQTVYSKERGSAAAPTAGLHFTKEHLDKIESMGVTLTYVTLHVGLGTFRPVKVESVENHEMHSEFYSLNEENAQIIDEAKKEGRRVISVGTTSTRVLETIANDEGYVRRDSGYTKIFIYPGYHFKCVDALLTNFHLPASTLIMLVSALASKKIIMEAYEAAVNENYRFFSFGDAMFIKE